MSEDATLCEVISRIHRIAEVIVGAPPHTTLTRTNGEWLFAVRVGLDRPPIASGRGVALARAILDAEADIVRLGVQRRAKIDAAIGGD